LIHPAWATFARVAAAFSGSAGNDVASILRKR
jgi:hypothetical protein